MKIRPHIATLLLCLPLLAHAQLYKCKRADGSTIFQDGECPSGSETTKIAAPAQHGVQTLLLSVNNFGSYETTLSINGVTVKGIVDTGASWVTLSARTASAMGISMQGMAAGMSVTANGTAKLYHKTFSKIMVGDVDLYNVEVCIMENSPTLIGMSALKQFKIIQDFGKMTLVKQ